MKVISTNQNETVWCDGSRMYHDVYVNQATGKASCQDLTVYDARGNMIACISDFPILKEFIACSI